MRWRPLLAAALLAAPAPAAPGAEEGDPAPPPVGVRAARSAGGTRSGPATRIDAVLPGVLLAALAIPAEAREVGWRVLLLAGGEGDPDAPGSLWLLEPRGEGELQRPALERLRGDLPAGGKALAVMDLGGGNGPEVLLARLGDLFSLGPLADLEAHPGTTAAADAESPPEWEPPRHLLVHPGFDLRSLHPGRLRVARPGRARLAAAEVGVLRLWEGAAGRLRLAREIPLPVAAAREQGGLRLTSPPVRGVGGTGSGGALFAAGPEAHGRRRLRTVLVAPDAPAESSEDDAKAEGGGAEKNPGIEAGGAAASPEDAAGEAGTIEAWSLLPGPEVVEQSWIERVDGRPVLFAAVQSADRMGIFEKRRLRVFPLSADRTRGGRLPSFEVETQTRRWYQMGLEVADFDGDGRDDLLTLQPEGLGGGDLLLELFPGIGGGRFLLRPVRTKLDGDAEAWAFAADVTGDGARDLVAVGNDGVLRVHAATPGKKRRLVEEEPLWSVPLALPAGDRAVAVGSEGTEVQELGRPAVEELEVLDLDGDGRAEILLLTSDVGGRGVFTVVRTAG